MGVPKFYRFISERYPLINTKIENDNVPDMDNLYLDMNGIVHNCVRGNGSKNSEDGERYQNMLHVTRTNEDIFLDVFKYVDNIFSMIRPRKLLYFAIDGVAPRAKMNQQRSRRFRSARERTEEHARRLAEDPMYVAADSTPFDSNCISPGTEFMQQLTDGLEYYVSERMTHNPQWADIEVILSGAEAPGEGEHKIMEYIRAVKVAGEMPPNTRHCLYGLDADLIMLALVSHEPHFFLLREKVDFSAYWKKKGGPRTVTQLDTITFGQFELLSIGLLREYLALDIGSGGNSALQFFDVERIVDDFVFMLMLVGNDFLPHLPTIEIADGMVVAMMHLYKRLLPRIGGYLTESGKIFPERVELFVAKLALFEPRSLKRKERDQRSRGPRGSHGPKNLFEDAEDLDAIWQFSETSGISEPASNYDIVAEIAKCRVVTHSEKHSLEKQKYYAEKFGPEFTKDQECCTHELTTHYMQGVVWTLKYYFEGCQSWRWYYPYHYAPFPSDLVALRGKVDPSNLNFSPDDPFLPLQQLMSVLPPASCLCIPAPYRKLMTSPVSPIRDFYVEDFKIDMNGKRNEWEAVVLLPFVDAERLFDAMRTIPETDLTASEKRRNSLGQSIVFRQDRKGFSKEVKSPFPHRLRAFVSCARGTPLSLPVIPAGTAFPPAWVIGTHAAGSASWVSDLPTLYPIPHAGRLEKLAVNLFGFPSRLESLAITLGSWEVKSRDFVFFDDVPEPTFRSAGPYSAFAPVGNCSMLRNGYKPPGTVQEAHSLGISVGSQVWTHFPWRVSGTVEAVMDESICVRGGTVHLSSQPPIVSKTVPSVFINSSNGIAASLMEKGGVDIDQPKVLVEIRPIPSTKKSLFGSAVSETSPLVFSAVTVLTAEMACKEPGTGNSTPFSSQVSLAVDQISLFVGRGQFFGSLCKIKELLPDAKARVHYSALQKSAREPAFGYDIAERWQSQRWKSLSQVASKCSMSVSVANAFLGSVRVKLENGKDEIDLGLGVKYSSRALHIPGYAKVNEYGTYFFSEKTISLLLSYKQAFPELFTAVLKFMSGARSKGAPVYEPRQLFPTASDSEGAVMAIGSWISASEVASLPLVTSGSLVLPRDAVLDLERSVLVAKSLQEEFAKTLSNDGQAGEVCVISQRQLRNGSESLDWQKARNPQNSQCLEPVSSDGRALRLGDRVANRIAYTGTPFGLRGCVIGIHNGPKPAQSRDSSSSSAGDKRRQRKLVSEPASAPSSCTVEVVFDEEFIGGGDLNGLCSPGKGKAVPAASLYTIRPDRENKYYASNFARVAKNVIARCAAMEKASPATGAKNRGKAIRAAAVESYRKAMKSPKKTSRTQGKGLDAKKSGQIQGHREEFRVPQNPLTMPIAEFASSAQRASPTQRTSAVNPGNVLSEEDPQVLPVINTEDETAALTARIKAALGIASGSEQSTATSEVTGATAEHSAPLSTGGNNENGPIGLLSSVSEKQKPEPSNNGASRRKPRHRNRRQNAARAPAPVRNEISSDSGNNVDTSSGFASVWNQLKTRSNGQ